MTTDPTPQTLPLDRPRYLEETSDGWFGADHPDGPWRPIPGPQTQPPFPVGAEPVADHFLSPIVNDPTTIAVDRWSLSDAIRRAWLRHGQDSWCSIADDVINEMRETQSAVTVAEEPSPTVRFPVYNNTGAEIPKGTPVYVTGNSGTRITIAPADASVDVENVTAPEPSPTVRYEFEITDEHGQTVASGDAATEEEAEREGREYLAQYEQDGPCTLELRRVEVLEVSSPELAPAVADLSLWQVLAPIMDESILQSLRDTDDPDAEQDHYDAERISSYKAVAMDLADWLVPEEAPPVAPTDSPAWLHWQQRQAIRALLTTEAATAEAGE